MGGGRREVSKLPEDLVSDPHSTLVYCDSLLILGGVSIFSARKVWGFWLKSRIYLILDSKNSYSEIPWNENGIKNMDCLNLKADFSHD